jgi:hypothetical protein
VRHATAATAKGKGNRNALSFVFGHKISYDSAMWSEKTSWIILAALLAAMILASTLMLAWEKAEITSIPSELAGEGV